MVLRGSLRIRLLLDFSRSMRYHKCTAFTHPYSALFNCNIDDPSSDTNSSNFGLIFTNNLVMTLSSRMWTITPDTFVLALDTDPLSPQLPRPASRARPAQPWQTRLLSWLLAQRDLRTWYCPAGLLPLPVWL